VSQDALAVDQERRRAVAQFDVDSHLEGHAVRGAHGERRVRQQQHRIALVGRHVDEAAPLEAPRAGAGLQPGDLLGGQPLEQVAVLEKPELLIHAAAPGCGARRPRECVNMLRLSRANIPEQV
jgi:hypothetical protein